MQVDTQAEMPKYKCHKEVWALKIKEIQEPDKLKGHSPFGQILVFEDDLYAPLQVSEEYLVKHQPHAGGYYVVYKDGYKSFSPAEAFEEGYSRI